MKPSMVIAMFFATLGACFGQEVAWTISYNAEIRSKSFRITINDLAIKTPEENHCWAGPDYVVYDQVTGDTYILTAYADREIGTYKPLIASAAQGTMVKKCADGYYLIIQGALHKATSSHVAEDGSLEMIEGTSGSKIVCSKFQQAEVGALLTCRYPEAPEESKVRAYMQWYLNDYYVGKDINGFTQKQWVPQLLFDCTHPVGKARGITIEKIEENEGFFAVMVLLFWEGPIEKNGQTRYALKVEKDSAKIIGLNFINTNGITTKFVDDFAASFVQGLQIGLGVGTQQ